VTNFILIADGLDVAPALAELAALPEFYWTDNHGDADRLVPMLGPDRRRRQEDRLPALWALVEQVHALAARDFGDAGRIDYARVGLLPPGKRVAPHADGHDGVRHRRYQIVLASGPEAALTLAGESRNLKPGEAWQIDTSRIHSAANPDPVPRIIIMFDSRADA
jgi:hypothetical protein